MSISRAVALLLGLAPILAPGAAASDGLPLPSGGALLCFAGAVDDGPLRAVTLSLEDGAYGVYFWLGAVSEAGERFMAGGTCRYDEEGFVCPIDGDGGWFLLEPAAGGGVAVVPVTGLRLEGPGDDGAEASPRLPGRQLLAPAPLDRCA